MLVGGLVYFLTDKGTTQVIRPGAHYDLVAANELGEKCFASPAISGGQLQVIRIDTPADTNAAAASAEGIQAFNLDKGEACFLGGTVASGAFAEGKFGRGLGCGPSARSTT